MKNQIKNILLVMMIIGFQNNYMQESKDLKNIHEQAQNSIDFSWREDALEELLHNKGALESTPLFEAIMRGQAETVKTLIAGGIDVNAEITMDDETMPPLALAIAMQNYDIVDALIKAGANVNNIIEGMPVLYIAINNIEVSGDVEIGKNIIKRLIAAHADLNTITTFFDETPLFTAVEKGNRDIVQILVEAGADVHAENKKGNTALDIANKNKNRSIARYLISKGAIALDY